METPASQSIINQLGRLLADGQQIAEMFEKTNATASLVAHYTQWSADVEQYLVRTLDQAYAAQFRSALSINTVKDGINLAGAGTWQRLEGQNAFLSQIIAQLRRV